MRAEDRPTRRPLRGSGSSTGIRSQLHRRVVLISYVCACILATVQFLRSYFFVNSPYLDALRYESGMERMPYQSRILMSILMRFAHGSALMTRSTGFVRGTLHAPDVFILFLVGLASFGLMAWAIRSLYLESSPRGKLAWVPYPLALAMMAETYIVRFQQAIYFPYDLLAASLFTFSLYLCYKRNYLLLLPVFVLGCFTRETIILIVPLLLLNMESLPRISRNDWKDLGMALSLSLAWLLIYRHLKHLYAHNPSEGFSRVSDNLATLRSPQQWSQVASGCGFVMLIPFIFWNSMPDLRLRRYSLLIPLWVIVIFSVGLIGESRVFGELIGFLAVYCTLLFENLYIGSSLPKSA